MSEYISDMRWRNRPYFLLKDIGQSVKENGATFFFTIFFALLGVALGVYVGVNADEETVFSGIFSLLFSPKYEPLRWAVRYFIRFSLYFLVICFGYFFLFPWLFAVPGIFLFSKFMAETATLSLRFDPFVSAVFSVILIYLPLFLVGIFLYFCLLTDVIKHKICRGNPFNAKFALSVFRYAVKPIAAYLVLTLIIFFALCGTIYLLVAAV